MEHVTDVKLLDSGVKSCRQEFHVDWARGRAIRVCLCDAVVSSANEAALKVPAFVCAPSWPMCACW
jgi:hypothetical protein